MVVVVERKRPFEEAVGRVVGGIKGEDALRADLDRCVFGEQRELIAGGFGSAAGDRVPGGEAVAPRLCRSRSDWAWRMLFAEFRSD
jgi:hypothetical protein